MAQSGGAEALGLFGIDHHHPPAAFGAHVPDHDRGPRRRDEGTGAVRSRRQSAGRRRNNKGAINAPDHPPRHQIPDRRSQRRDRDRQRR